MSYARFIKSGLAADDISTVIQAEIDVANKPISATTAQIVHWTIQRVANTR
jgi:hypothetical protein